VGYVTVFIRYHQCLKAVSFCHFGKTMHIHLILTPETIHKLIRSRSNTRFININVIFPFRIN